MYRIYTNVFKYLKGINYEPETAELNREVFDKYSQFHRYIKIKTTHTTEGSIYLFLLFDTANNIDVAKSFGKKKTESYSFEGMFNTIPDSKAKIMFICKENIIPHINKSVAKYKKKELILKTIPVSYFIVDVRNHVLVPEHILCTDEEKKNITSELYISNYNMLPKIKLTDPQVVWLNGKLGDVIKIIRNDITGPVIYYRIVIM